MNKFHQKENGFTLIEMLMYIALAALIGTALCAAFVGGTRSYRVSFSQSHNAMSARNALNVIQSLLRYADNGSIINIAAGTSASSVKFTVAGGTNVTITSGGNSIIITRGATVRTWARGQVQALLFTRDSSNPQKMTVTLSIRDDRYTGSQKLVLNTNVIMLNM